MKGDGRQRSVTSRVAQRRVAAARLAREILCGTAKRGPLTGRDRQALESASISRCTSNADSLLRLDSAARLSAVYAQHSSTVHNDVEQRTQD